jgi:hypothetical protein
MQSVKDAVAHMVSAMPGKIKTSLAPSSQDDALVLLGVYGAQDSGVVHTAKAAAPKPAKSNQNQNQNQNGVPEKAPQTGGFPPKYYKTAEWNLKTKHVKWNLGEATFEDKTTLSKLEKLLTEAIQNPKGGALQFKKPI